MIVTVGIVVEVVVAVIIAAVGITVRVTAGMTIELLGVTIRVGGAAVSQRPNRDERSNLHWRVDHMLSYKAL